MTDAAQQTVRPWEWLFLAVFQCVGWLVLSLVVWHEEPRKALPGALFFGVGTSLTEAALHYCRAKRRQSSSSRAEGGEPLLGNDLSQV